jgi:hypothetical protein
MKKKVKKERRRANEIRRRAEKRGKKSINSRKEERGSEKEAYYGRIQNDSKDNGDEDGEE